MDALSVVEDFDGVEDGFSGGFTGGSVSWLTHSVFRVWITAHALFNAVLLEQLTVAVGGLPRSVCQSKPLAGFRFQIAMSNASLTSLVFMRSAIDQPTICRE